MKNILIAAAWPYVNGDLHVGHTGGYLLPADIIAKYHRLIGNNVCMVSGADCHGTPVTVEAEKNNISPQEVVDKYYPTHLEIFKKLNISFDIYTKTTTQNHINTVQEVFLALLNNGFIFKKSSFQFFSEKENKFLPDRYVQGICPFCNKLTSADQCENCNKIIEASDLKEPVSKLTKNPVILKETEHYYMDWKKTEGFLKTYFDTHKDNWKDWVQSETKAWLDQGLLPRPITRDMDWGIEIPKNKIPENLLIENIENKRIYVWFEAVIGYLSATKELLKNKYVDFWFNENCKQYYFMGKDNLVFHTVFWPAQLHSFNTDINLPDVLSINNFFNLEGKKFSKSKGVTISNIYMVDTYGLDQTRFYLASISPENNDSNFTWKDFQQKTNDVLNSNFGNLVNRILKLFKDYDIPNMEPSNEIIEKIKETKEKVCLSLEKVEIKNYVNSFCSLIDFSNKYLSIKAPWKNKENIDEFNQTMIDCFYLLIAIDILIKPLLIESSKKIEDMLNINISNWEDDIISQIKENILKIKRKDDIRPIFSRIEDDQINIEIEKLN